MATKKGKQSQASSVHRHDKLGDVIGNYLKDLGMDQNTLAEKIGERVTPAVVSNWVTGQRRPARDTIWQIAQALGQVAHRRATSGRRMVRTDAISILLHLLRAGDYEIEWEGRYDIVWERYLSDRSRDYKPKLRIGYAQVPPYIDKARLDESICWRIAKRVVRELHAEPVDVPRTWSSLVDGVEDDEIDLIAPLFMRTPTRASRLLFSESIGLQLGYRAVIPTKDLKRATTRPTGAEEPVVVPGIIEVLEIAGEAGQLFCQFAPEAKLLPRVDEKIDPDLKEVAKSLLEIASTPNRVPCMITEIITSLNIEKEHSGRLTSVALPPDVPMWYPLAFACHRREGRLNDAVNIALENLRNSGTLHDWFIQWQEELKKEFNDREVIRIDPNFPSYPKSLATWVEQTKKLKQKMRS